MSHFPDIDQLIELAQTDPGQLERIRKREVEALINSAAPHIQRRLRGLQFQIDCQRQIHPNSMGSCLTITKMMMASLNKLNDALQGIDASEPTHTGGAAVINFPVANQA